MSSGTRKTDGSKAAGRSDKAEAIMRNLQSTVRAIEDLGRGAEEEEVRKRMWKHRREKKWRGAAWKVQLATNLGVGEQSATNRVRQKFQGIRLRGVCCREGWSRSRPLEKRR